MTALLILYTGCAFPYQTDTQAPDEVTELTATEGNGEITLSWKEPNDADYVGLEITGDNGLELVKIMKGTVSHTIKGCINNIAYTFKIQTIDVTRNKSDGVSIMAIPKEGTL